MLNIQDIWNSIEEHKAEQREIRAVYRDILESDANYESVVEELDSLKARKKQIENGARSSMEEKMTRLDYLTHEVAEQKQLLADLALSTLLKGERVEVRGAHDAEYEPLFAVRFKKKG